tara:strand:- start:13 stop:504 length:492 start_codon:yes stop_codon:yes gene_type:complete
MPEKKLVISKKIIFYSSFALLFALLSFFSYSPSMINDDSEPVSLVIEQPSSKKIIIPNDNSAIDIKEKTDSLVKEKQNISLKVDILSLENINAKYLIVIGAFREKNNAIGLCQQMLKNGYKDCHVIYNGTSLYWVTYNSYKSKKSALDEFNNLKIDGWIKKVR